tara:strand:+ start:315 stop:710 length:396 start_codon:yes stop_codon:yes gene_type:complete
MGAAVVTKLKLREMIRSIIKEVSPPGWGGTVKAMKKHKKDIDNPWALAWHMKGKGDKPHYKDEEGSPKKYKKYKHEGMSEGMKVNIDDLLKNPKVKEIMKRLRIKSGDSKSVAKIVQHFVSNPGDLKAIGA